MNAVSPADAAATEYRQALVDLVTNNKTQINLLTILAEDYANFAPKIVEAIENHMYTCKNERKLPILYVIDSILKNVSDSPYRDLFSKVISKIFLHIFLQGDEHIRLSLYKVRQTWSNIFSPALLYNLDKSVKREDNAWPISTEGSENSNGASRIHVNPRFIQDNRVKDPRIAKKKEVRSENGASDVLETILGQRSPAHLDSASKSSSPLGSKRKAADNHNYHDRKKKRSPLSSRDKDHRKHRHDDRPRLRDDRRHDMHDRERDRVRDRDHHDKPVVASTALPGSHAFSAPIIAVANNTPPYNMPPSASVYPPTDISAPQSVPSQAYPPMNQQPTAPQPGYVNQYGGGAVRPPFPPTNPTPSQPVHITNDTVRLEGIPANNRIFVDGKAHEVFYIENTAVIERNGLPHRIYFSGTPRKVVIDNTSYDLAFNESITVFIDGLPHVLRFGAPSRELYMGDFAFKGQFGGPPINATINGIRHQIRLSGPAPEVKIEPDPAHDLARFMPSVREKIVEPKPSETSFAQISKILSLIQHRKPAVVKSEPSKPSVIPQRLKENTPPISSGHSLDTISRAAAPSSSLRDFSMQSLKIRYDAIVEAIHVKQKNACPHCGLRMELKGPKYDRHLDWHVKKNLETLDRTSASRPWYPATKEWLKNEDEPETTATKTSEFTDEAVYSGPAVVSNEASSKECDVCGETFEEYFDEYDDVWKYKNCVLQDGKAYHSGCAQDASRIDLSVISLDNENNSIVPDMKPLNNITN